METPTFSFIFLSIFQRCPGRRKKKEWSLLTGQRQIMGTLAQSLPRVAQLVNEPKTSWSDPWSHAEHASILWMACICQKPQRPQRPQDSSALSNLQKPFGKTSNRLVSRLIPHYPNCFRVSGDLSVPTTYTELHLCFWPHICSLSLWCRQPLWFS